MKRAQKIFYSGLLVLFFPFFLLHWNGMFSQTYYWALESVGGIREFLPQLIASFISSVVIFSVIALLFECGRWVENFAERR